MLTRDYGGMDMDAKCGEGIMVKIKKRNVDSGKFVHVEDDTHTPPIVGPFESLARKMLILNNIVMRLPQG
ncbi:hypothetical protein KY290_024865 [Solanum tuberosum]|uniref:Uncharacterized protein n=1 Tax=Solanum tuberosum TaxID=4113 RepID=A0ABQ7URY2_SOLTU|nr:hypothetical protein KY284_023723 [Solanum tuberosum]KAH0754595.1 hypothetical protein KY290_024865 [Solanum tuberosum]